MLAFVAFASVSCWATAESLHLLLSNWPIVLCWIVTIGFFIIASLGTKLIVDSLNQNIYLEKRGAHLILGIILVLIFWLICSMPTNTHTFFYRTVINDKVTTDISTTRGYLNQIRFNTKNEDMAKLKVDELKNRIDIKLGELEAEIRNEAEPGFGPKSKEIFAEFAKELGVAKIVPLAYHGNSKQELDKLCDAYRTKIYILFESKKKNILQNILTPNPSNLKEAKLNDENLLLCKKYIDEGELNLNNADDIKNICDKLNSGYNTIRKNKNFVLFDSESDESLYTSRNPVTRVKRMISVFDTWRDFIRGEYSGHGFLFWILISVLVDVAAFIFFDLAFKKEE